MCVPPKQEHGRQWRGWGGAWGMLHPGVVCRPPPNSCRPQGPHTGCFVFCLPPPPPKLLPPPGGFVCGCVVAAAASSSPLPPSSSSPLWELEPPRPQPQGPPQGRHPEKTTDDEHGTHLQQIPWEGEIPWEPSREWGSPRKQQDGVEPPPREWGQEPRQQLPAGRERSRVRPSVPPRGHSVTSRQWK